MEDVILCIIYKYTAIWLDDDATNQSSLRSVKITHVQILDNYYIQWSSQLMGNTEKYWMVSPKLYHHQDYGPLAQSNLSAEANVSPC